MVGRGGGMEGSRLWGTREGRKEGGGVGFGKVGVGVGQVLVCGEGHFLLCMYKLSKPAPVLSSCVVMGGTVR